MDEQPNSTDKDFLIAFLRDRDIACPSCGYNVRNLSVPRCPECGEELALRLAMIDPKQGAMIVGLIGLSAGAGLNGLLLLYGGIQLLRMPSMGRMGTFFTVTAVGFVVLAIALALWLYYWRRIRRTSSTARITLASVCWLLTLIDLVIFSFSLK